MKAIIRIWGDYFGEMSVPPTTPSIAFMCDECGPIAWATLEVPAPTGWSFEYSRCEKHPRSGWGRPAGSLLRWPEPIIASRPWVLGLDDLPERALRRELNLLREENRNG